MKHLFAMLFALSLAGCAGGSSGDATSGCVDSDECAVGESCDEGLCEPTTCRGDDDCPFRFFCNGGLCDEVPDFCARNGDCPAGHLCDGETQRCLPASDVERGCQDRNDCFAGEDCVRGICRGPEEDAGTDPEADVEDGDAEFDAPEDVPEDIADVPEDTQDLPEDPDVPEDTQDLPEDTQDLPEDTPEDVPEDLPEDTQDLPEDTPEDLPEDTQDLPEDTQDVLEDMPEDTNPDLPEDVEPDMPDEFPVNRGVYGYTALRATGQGIGRLAAFAPDGSYALYTESYDIVRRFDWETQMVVETDLSPQQGAYRFTDLEFAPDGSHAILTGYRLHDREELEGVIFLWEDGTWTQLEDATRDRPFEAIAWPWDGGLPVVLSRHDDRASQATLRWLDVEVGDFVGDVVGEFASAGCTDAAYVKDEFGDPAVLIACGINGADVLLWNGAWRDGRDMGNSNLGNTHRVAAHPSGDYAHLVSSSGRAIYRFEGGLIEGYGDAARFSRYGVFGMKYQDGGRRALTFGQAGRTPLTGTLIEYRHDLDACTNPFTVCHWTDVSIPSFSDGPWLGTTATSIHDVAWRPGCDGGLLVGGRNNVPLVAEFQLENGTACR